MVAALPVPLRILVTGMGAPGVRGSLYALRSNPDRAPVFIVGTDMNPKAVGQYFSDVFYTVPAPESPDYLGRIQEICERESVVAVIPQTTRETEFFCRHKNELQRIGVRVLVPEASAIEIANNKIRTVGLFAELGLPAPAFWVVDTLADFVQACHDLGYPGQPVVVKAPISNGKRGFRIIRESPWTLERFLNEKPDGDSVPLEVFVDMLDEAESIPQLLVTEYLPGPEYSVDAFRHGDLYVALPRRRVEIRSGISFLNIFENDIDMIKQTLAFAKAANLAGVFGVQYKRDRDGRPIVLECNPRVQGTMVASLFAGVNLIWMGIRALIGEPMDFSHDDINWDAQFIRYWGGLGVVGDVGHEI